MSSPFHPGEQALQTLAGVRERSERMGQRMVRDALPRQHQDFYAALPWLVVGSLDSADRPWASVLTGAPGFLHALGDRALRVDALPAPGLPLWLEAGAPVGLLGLELATRRRNRLNGKVTALDARGFTVAVGQCFGNCPQYIQAREVLARAPGPAGPAVEEPALLSSGARAWVQGADTFFIASAAPGARGPDPREGVDVSHRGGREGFVRVTEEAGASVLTWRELPGNFAFNTLGNLHASPRAGLAFVDFSSGDLLCLTGEARLLWGREDVGVALRVEQAVRLPAAVPLRWSEPELAPELRVNPRG